MNSPPTFPMRLPAIRVKQQLGEFFAVAIPARILRQVIFLDPTRISSVDRANFLYRLVGSQRASSSSRARNIGEYIDTVESAFPNSVILSANYDDKGALLEDRSKRWQIETDECGDYLLIPGPSPMASVIDGQHRLLGFDHCKDERRDMQLLCSVYIDLPLVYQAYLFATININQRKVDKSLAYEQFGYNLDDENSTSWAPDKLAVFFTRRLNLNPESPLFQHIKIAPLEADMVFSSSDTAKWQVSTACVVEGLLTLFSSKPKSDRDLLHSLPIGQRHRNKLPQDNSPLRDDFRSCQHDKLWQLILNFLNLCSANLWAKAKDNSYIRKTIGVQALFDVFRITAQKVPREGLESKLKQVIQASEKVDFGDQFFQASGKGRMRVKNAMLSAAGELREDDVSHEDYPSYLRLAPPPSEVGLES